MNVQTVLDSPFASLPITIDLLLVHHKLEASPNAHSVLEKSLKCQDVNS